MQKSKPVEQLLAMAEELVWLQKQAPLVAAANFVVLELVDLEEMKRKIEGIKTRLPKNEPDKHAVLIKVDGASKGNPGPAGVGLEIIDSKGYTLDTRKHSIPGRHTNNEAEYYAVIYARNYAIGCGFKRLHVWSDSELVVKGINGEHVVKNQSLKFLHEIATQRHPLLTIEHIPRKDNKVADGLAKEAAEAASKMRVGTPFGQKGRHNGTL